MPSARWRVGMAALTAALISVSCGASGPPTSSSTSTPAASTPTGAATDPTAPPTAMQAASSWTSYHADASRTAAVPAGAPLNPARALWKAALGGKVYGQPLVSGGRVFVATETDRVAALDPSNGAVLWSASIGTPLTNAPSVIGCGDIDPLGITSTPVVDPTAGTIYVVGEERSDGGAVVHRLVGLDVTNGAVKVSEDVDPPLPAGEKAVTLLQRAGLALANGRVYVAYGGNFGDCGAYHGWVVSVNETGPLDERSFESAPDGEGGAVWQSGGAPALDAAGNLYVSTGNSVPDPAPGVPDPARFAESVVKLSPALQPLASFKDRMAGGDADLSTGNPVLLPDGELFAVGKTDIGFLLRQRDLSQVATIGGICGSDPDGGPAYDRRTDQVFVPCQGGGIQVVDLATRSATKKLGGANGAPVVIGSDVWALEYPSGSLVEYAAAGGATVQKVAVGGVASFVSPSSALGLVLVPTDTGVTAVAGPSGVGRRVASSSGGQRSVG